MFIASPVFGVNDVAGSAGSGLGTQQAFLLPVLQTGAKTAFAYRHVSR